MSLPNVFALLHTRSSAAGTEIKVRSADKAFTASVVEGMAKFLREAK